MLLKFSVDTGICFVPKPDYPSPSSDHSGAWRLGKVLPCDFQRWLENLEAVYSPWRCLSLSGQERGKESEIPPQIQALKSVQWNSVSSRRMRVTSPFLCQINVYLTSLSIRSRPQLVGNIWKNPMKQHRMDNGRMWSEIWLQIFNALVRE